MATGAQQAVEIAIAGVGDFIEASEIERQEMSPDIYPMFFFKQAESLFGSGFHVAKIGGKVVGYALTARHANDGQTAELYSLVVSSRHRRKGIGRSLVEASIDWAARQSCATLKLTVEPDNKAAVKLYERVGYTQISRVNDYYGPGADRLIMQREAGGIA
jgi:ribosomal protein S18 acetylase RimI-like enzyme